MLSRGSDVTAFLLASFSQVEQAMTVTLTQLNAVATIPKVIFHSLDTALYQVSVMLQGETQEHMVVDRQGALLRSHNLISLQALFERLPVEQQVLRQHSAYDEMVNQPVRMGSNQLEVPLGNNGLG